MLEMIQEFFNHYIDILLDQKEKCLHIAFGDLNTRLHARCRSEERVIGPFIWSRGEKLVKKMNPIDKELRSVLVAALKAADHIHMNSFSKRMTLKKLREQAGKPQDHPTHPPYMRK